jgi:serine/threonine-protein kinase ULK/ATG1
VFFLSQGDDADGKYLYIGIKRTKLRLVRCRIRMAMNHRDRVNDARADQNLADVARIPAPWDAKPSPSEPTTSTTTTTTPAVPTS